MQPLFGAFRSLARRTALVQVPPALPPRCTLRSLPPRLYSTTAVLHNGGPRTQQPYKPSAGKRPPQRIHLGNLSPAPGSKTAIKRFGRGQGSGRGGTSGRGHKGQNSRSGKPTHRSFEGGQTPITRRFPKRGFHNYLVKTYEPLNLDRLQHWIDQGRIRMDGERAITAHDLLRSKCVHQIQDGVKLLGDGSTYFHSPIKIVVSRCSQSAIKAIERAGGTVVCRHYNELGIRDLARGDESHRLAAPMRQKDIVFYSDWERNRGYIGMPSTVLEDPAFRNARLEVPAHLLPAHRLPQATLEEVVPKVLPPHLLQAEGMGGGEQPSA